MDTQSKDTSKDDLQQTSVELPEVSIPILHRSGKQDAGSSTYGKYCFCQCPFKVAKIFIKLWVANN